MKVEQYYDKQIDKLTRIETAINRLSKAFENISNFCDMMVELYREESISKAEQCKDSVINGIKAGVADPFADDGK